MLALKTKALALTNNVKELRFRRLLTDVEWANLPTTTKARFGNHLADGQVKTYTGHVLNTDMNLFGKCLSMIMRLFNAPLPTETDNCGAAAVVTVTGVDGAQVWSRTYNGKRKATQSITSRKQFSGPTGLEEMLGYGLGMTLKLHSEDNAILFTADRFFLTLFDRRVYLPATFTPGHLTISHIDLGNGVFCFGMSLKHRLFGQLVNQNILFTDT